MEIPQKAKSWIAIWSSISFWMFIYSKDLRSACGLEVCALYSLQHYSLFPYIRCSQLPVSVVCRQCLKYLVKTSGCFLPIFWILPLFIIFVVVLGRGTFWHTKILTMYQIHHTWIHPLHHSPLSPSPGFSFLNHIIIIIICYLSSFPLNFTTDYHDKNNLFVSNWITQIIHLSF
jgi:hypothetical protein